MRIAGNEPVYAGPLVSWDIFMQGYRKQQQLADDRVALEALAKEQQWQHNFDFSEHLYKQRNTIIVTAPSLNIMYASSQITEMTGYQPLEIIGKTPKIFQGVQTSTETRQLIRQAVSTKKSFETMLINYRKDGSSYKCYIKGYPVFNRYKEMVNYIAFEKELLRTN